jgi:malate/lactate dehydrogenase
MKIAILGTGRVGASIASHLLAGFPRFPLEAIYLHDVDIRKAKAEKQDLNDMRDILKKPTRIDLLAPEHEPDLYIITAGIPRKSSFMKHDFHGNLRVVRRCIDLCVPGKPILLVTNPIKELFEAASKQYRDRIIHPIGFELDGVRVERTGMDPEKTAEFILDNKGYTAHGVTAEVLRVVREAYHDGAINGTVRGHVKAIRGAESNHHS